MKSNVMSWVFAGTVISASLALSFWTFDLSSKAQKIQPTPTPAILEDLRKYASVDYDQPEPSNSVEREERKLKNERYDVSLAVLKNPLPEVLAIGGSDVPSEPEPANPIPLSESSLVVIGYVRGLAAFMANEKRGIYSEFKVEIEQILITNRKQKFRVGDTLTADRTGGVVNYPNGQKVLYKVDWQNLPEVDARYLFFLGTDNTKSSNYKILTAYRLQNGIVTALDNLDSVRAFSGRSEREFLKLIRPTE